MRSRFQAWNVLVCIVMVAAFVGCAGSEKRASTGEYIDDSVIQAKVKAELAKDPEVGALQINLETFKGVVQLSGFVESAAEKKKAGEIASRVKGVKAVKNNLVVK